MLLTATSFLYSNNTPVPGYVITINSDTLHGYLAFNHKNGTPNEILFKETEGGTGLVYTPALLIEFGTGYEVFRSAVVHINSDLLLSDDTSYGYDTVFLQALILGEKDLYSLIDSAGNENFFIKDETGFVWLQHGKIIISENGKTKKIANNKYIGQLIVYFEKCLSINLILSSKTPYKQKKLLRAFCYYYECTYSKADYQINAGKRKVFFWLD